MSVLMDPNIERFERDNFGVLHIEFSDEAKLRYALDVIMKHATSDRNKKVVGNLGDMLVEVCVLKQLGGAK